MSTTISDDTPRPKGLCHIQRRSLVSGMRRLRDLERSPTNTSRIGDSSRKFVVVSDRVQQSISYYMNTYGFHTIHGRAPTVATGVKVANPDLSVWMITGDGDGLSIGANHLLHLLRRNLDINVLLFNNRIYGLTKGQYSPTSEVGKKTKSTPLGSVDHPINPLLFALGSEATFVARTSDTDMKHMVETFKAAQAHKGTLFVEVFQNCVIFNDKTFAPVTSRDSKDDQVLVLEEGQPLVFGANRDKGIRLNGLDPKSSQLEMELTRMIFGSTIQNVLIWPTPTCLLKCPIRRFLRQSV